MGGFFRLGISTTASIATVTPGAGWSGATAQPANQGSGNTDDVIANWDAVPFQTFAGTFNVCVAAFHNSGIAKVSIGVDGGSLVDVTSTTANPIDGAQEYCVQANPATWSDGQHEFRAIAYPVSGVPRVLASTRNATVSIASPAVFTEPAHGYSAGKGVQFSAATLPTGLTAGTTYYVSTAGLTPGSYQVADTSAHALAGTNSINTSGSASTLTVSFANAGGNEIGMTGSESLWINTNHNGNLNALFALYVDPAGTDNSSCGSIGSPCLTVHQAIVNMVPSGDGAAVTVDIPSSTFTKNGHGFKNNAGIVFTTTGALPTPLVANQLYWVTNKTANIYQVSATPGGSAITLSGSQSGTQTEHADIGGDVVYLNAGAYAYGGATENFGRYATEAYLNIEPSPGTPKSSVSYTSTTSTAGVKTTKVALHNLLMDGSGGGFQFAGGGLPTTGSSMIWLDGVSTKGPGPTTGISSTDQPLGSWTGGSFWTNTTNTNWVSSANFAVLVQNDLSTHIGGNPYNNSLTVVASTAQYVGEDQNDSITLASQANSGDTTLTISDTVASGCVSGWIVYSPNGTYNSALPATQTVASCFGSSIVLNNAMRGTIPTSNANGTLSLGDGFHPDFAFTNGTGVNQILYGDTCTVSCNAEGYFMSAGTFLDAAAINNNISTQQFFGAGLNAIFLRGNPTTNMYLLNDTWSGTVESLSSQLGSATVTDLIIRNILRTQLLYRRGDVSRIRKSAGPA
jgi:hypothetical protein